MRSRRNGTKNQVPVKVSHDSKKMIDLDDQDFLAHIQEAVGNDDLLEGQSYVVFEQKRSVLCEYLFQIPWFIPYHDSRFWTLGFQFFVWLTVPLLSDLINESMDMSEHELSKIKQSRSATRRSQNWLWWPFTLQLSFKIFCICNPFPNQSHFN